MTRTFLIGCALAALASCNKPSQPSNQASNQVAEVPEASGIKGVHRDHKGEPPPAALFNDPAGKETSLKSFAGKPTLVNLWASWCGPCVKELPTLDRLAASGEGKLNVVAISQDDAPHASVEAFLRTHKIERLHAYQDPRMALSGSLNAEVLPTSILYDSSGREVWRYVGDQDWTSARAAKLIAEAGVR